MDDDCRRILSELETYLDRECPDHVQELVRVHLEDCGGCLDRADFAVALREIIANRCCERAPEGLAQRITARLQLPDTV